MNVGVIVGRPLGDDPIGQACGVGPLDGFTAVPHAHRQRRLRRGVARHRERCASRGSPAVKPPEMVRSADRQGHLVLVVESASSAGATWHGPRRSATCRSSALTGPSPKVGQAAGELAPQAIEAVRLHDHALRDPTARPGEQDRRHRRRETTPSTTGTAAAAPFPGRRGSPVRPARAAVAHPPGSGRGSPTARRPSRSTRRPR